jgi:Short C-terminal domain/Bacterial PH domain
VRLSSARGHAPEAIRWRNSSGMEQVIMEVPAIMEGAGGLGQGKLRVTSERLVFERKKVFGGAGDVTSFPLSSIQSASISGVLEKKLKVRAGSTEVVFKSSITSSSDANLKSISDLLQRSMAGYPLASPVQTPGKPPPVMAEPAPTGWLDELERLARLHAAGALSDEEFAAAKRRLLESSQFGGTGPAPASRLLIAHCDSARGDSKCAPSTKRARCAAADSVPSRRDCRLGSCLV